MYSDGTSMIRLIMALNTPTDLNAPLNSSRVCIISFCGILSLDIIIWYSQCTARCVVCGKQGCRDGAPAVTERIAGIINMQSRLQKLIYYYSAAIRYKM